jgi:oxaloacetate decarboxylase gamma subunit
MMEVNLITEGFKFLALGMTTVFLFLLLMIYILKLQAKLVQKYFPDNIDNIPKVGVVEPAMTQQAEDEAKIIAAITAAITDHRKN